MSTPEMMVQFLENNKGQTTADRIIIQTSAEMQIATAVCFRFSVPGLLLKHTSQALALMYGNNRLVCIATFLLSSVNM